MQQSPEEDKRRKSSFDRTDKMSNRLEKARTKPQQVLALVYQTVNESCAIRTAGQLAPVRVDLRLDLVRHDVLGGVGSLGGL